MIQIIVCTIALVVAIYGISLLFREKKSLEEYYDECIKEHFRSERMEWDIGQYQKLLGISFGIDVEVCTDVVDDVYYSGEEPIDVQVLCFKKNGFVLKRVAFNSNEKKLKILKREYNKLRNTHK